MQTLWIPGGFDLVPSLAASMASLQTSVRPQRGPPWSARLFSQHASGIRSVTPRLSASLVWRPVRL